MRKTMIILVMAVLLPTAMRAWQPVGTATVTLPQTVGNGVTGIGDQTVKVTLTGWPDYVFGADYRLRSLPETEAYIREQGRLPEPDICVPVSPLDIERHPVHLRYAGEIPEGLLVGVLGVVFLGGYELVVVVERVSAASPDLPALCNLLT